MFTAEGPRAAALRLALNSRKSSSTNDLQKSADIKLNYINMVTATQPQRII